MATSIIKIINFKIIIKKIKGAFFGFLGKVLVGTCLGFPLWVLSRTLPNGFHLEPFGVLPPGQRIEPHKVLDRTFLAKRVLQGNSNLITKYKH